LAWRDCVYTGGSPDDKGGEGGWSDLLEMCIAGWMSGAFSTPGRSGCPGGAVYSRKVLGGQGGVSGLQGLCMAGWMTGGLRGQGGGCALEWLYS
jgi:hypothetical protein